MNNDPRIYDRDSPDYRDLALDLIERAMEVSEPLDYPESYCEWIDMCNRRRQCEEEKTKAEELRWPTIEECNEYWRKKEHE